jgi:ATP/maltotriose-dependent transcriptional regulator MalT
MIYADLELSLRRSSDDASDDSYTVELHSQLADSPAAPQSIVGPLPRVRFDASMLLEASQDPALYGERLTRMLFTDTRLRELLAQARSQAEEAQLPLRLRLRLDVADDVIHSLCWETLQGPDRGDVLCASERLLISRYLDIGIKPQVRVRPHAGLKVLVAVANPVDLEKFKLEPIDVAGQIEHCRSAFADMPTTILAQGYGERATIHNLTAALRDSPDILYLICHGTLRDGQPYLWLENDQGGISRVEGAEFIASLERLDQRPSLIVLASCRSAGHSHATGALAALGPRLAAAGIIAVVAMQGDITIETVIGLMPTFFRELRRHGQVDRALAAARGNVLNRHDWWMPALFMRVRDGMLWREPPIRAPSKPERPHEVEIFVGREKDLAYFREALATDHLAIITGHAGVGKTALATELAKEIEPHKVFWHTFEKQERVDGPVRKLTDEKQERVDDLVRKLAEFLAWHGQDTIWALLNTPHQSTDPPLPAKDLLDRLLETMHGQGYLLCFDDFQFIDDEDVYDLRHFMRVLYQEVRAGHVSLLITSWGMPTVFPAPIEPKQLGGLDTDGIHQLLDRYDVSLSVDQISALYELTGGNAHFLTLAVNAMREYIDPTGLLEELAEVGDIDTERIEEVLHERVDAILSDSQRAVMTALSVLRGSGSRDAIEAVLGPGSNAQRVLHELRHRNLLTRSSGKGGEYGQHGFMRAYYYRQQSRDERQEKHRRAGIYYEPLASEALKAAVHFEQAGDYARAATLVTANVWLLINTGQAPALRQMLERFIERQMEPDPATVHHLDSERWAAVQVALGALYPYVGERRLAHQWTNEAFRYLSHLPDSSEVHRLRARACAEMGKLLQHEAPQDALDWLQRGLEALTGCDIRAALAELHILVGGVRPKIGDNQGALSAVNQGLALLPPESHHLRVIALVNLGVIHHDLGDFEQAIEHTQQALKVCRQLKDYLRELKILLNLGAYKYIVGDWAGMVEGYEQAQALAERLGNLAHTQRVRLELNLGQVSINRVHDEAALEYLTNSRDLARKHDLREYELGSLVGLADLFLRQKNLENAASLLAEAEQLARKAEMKTRLPEIFRFWAELRLGRNEISAAMKDAKQSLKQAREIEDPYDEGLSLRMHGRVLQAAGQLQSALRAFKRSLALLASDPYEAARTKTYWGAALCDFGNKDQGHELLKNARATFAQLETKRDLALVDSLLQKN